MSFTRASLFLGAALVLGAAGGAMAADLGGYRGGGSLKDSAPVATTYVNSGPSWYIRGDGGYTLFDNPTITDDNTTALFSTGLENTFSAGGGVGRYLGNGWRTDVTADYLFNSDATAGYVINGYPTTARIGFDSTVVLANLYYDFDFGGRFSPYLGFGIGAAFNTTRAGTVTSVAADCNCDLAGTIDGDSETHVAGAFSAGATVKLRDRLSLDIGYRFLYLGEAKTGPVIVTSQAVPETFSADPTLEDLHAHQFRFGLRYDIN